MNWDQHEKKALEALEAQIAKQYPGSVEAGKAVAREVYQKYPIAAHLEAGTSVDGAVFIQSVGNLRNALAFAIMEAVEAKRLLLGISTPGPMN